MKFIAGAVVAGLALGFPAGAAEGTPSAAFGGPGSCGLEIPVDSTMVAGSDFDLIDDDRPADLAGKFMQGTGEKGDTVCVQISRDKVVALKVRPHGVTKPLHLTWGTVLFWVERDGLRSNKAAISLDCWDPSCAG